MTKSKILICSFLILFLFSATGCFAFGNNLSEIKGKFVFDSNRFEFLDVFITENGETKLLFKKASDPAWSTDDKKIACAYFEEDSKKHGILIIDSKGNKKEFIEMPEGQTSPCNLNWSPDDNKIYYVPHSIGMSGYKNKVYSYNFSSKTHTKIIEIYKTSYISNLKLSPKGDKLLVSYSDQGSRERGTYLFNSDGVGIKIIGDFKGFNGVWYPDNEHIAYITNLKEDGTRYSIGGNGFFFRMNVNTGEVEKLASCNMMVLNLKMSRDGKYIYYISGNPAGGRVVYVSPIDNPNKMIQITHFVITPPPNNSPSQDNCPDWYQEN